MQPTEKPVLKELTPNPTLPTLFVDAVDINARTDGSMLVRLSCSLPEARQELGRFLMNASTVKAVIDLLCRVTNYYPTPPTATLVKEKP
jgi:hypothetical protein